MDGPEDLQGMIDASINMTVVNGNDGWNDPDTSQDGRGQRHKPVDNAGIQWT